MTLSSRPAAIKPAVPAATLAITVPQGPVSLTPVIKLKPQHAHIQSVVVTTTTDAVAGEWNQTSWRPVAPLSWNTTYKVKVVAVDHTTGKQLVSVTTFTTPNSPVTLQATVSPANGQQVGMGAVWVVQFKQPLTPAEQSLVLTRLDTSESIPDTVGWHWWSSTQVDGRPQNFWPLNEVATLKLNFNGMLLNGHPVVKSNSSVSFTVNEQHEIKISAQTDRMLVYNNNQLLHNFPVSLGRPGFPTLSGTLIVLYKSPVVFMNSATIGHPGIYAENVYEDVAISSDGYFMHSAPWDVYDHGYANVSFGCVEQNPNNATWIYNWSEPGDVVIITGTTYKASEADGEGDWNIPWSQFTVPTPAATTAS